MELRSHLEHPPTLLSNAPALAGAHPEVPARVLQELCGNRQQEYSDQDLAGEFKFSYPLPSENAFAVDQASYPAPTLNHYSSRKYAQERKRQIDEEVEFAVLWHHVQKNQAYRKYRERQPQRSNQTQKHHDRDPIWSDEMEYAFFKALVRFKPMGRRKLRLDQGDKQRGRNELIAQYIMKATREDRGRKKVSSHIQVLKPMFKDDPLVLRYFSKREFSPSERMVGIQHRLASLQMPSATNFAPLAPSLQPILDGGEALPYGFERGVPAVQFGPPTPTDFFMYVQAKKAPGEATKVHSYTSLTSRGEDIILDHIFGWESYFPRLVGTLSEVEMMPEIVLFEASLDIYLGEMPADAELCIELNARLQSHFEERQRLECRTYFYDDGKPVTLAGGRSDKALCSSVEYENGSIHSIPLGSTFWAHRLYNLAKRIKDRARLSAMKAESSQPQHDALEEAGGTRDDIRRVTAVQEFHTSRHSNRGPSRLAFVFIWQFRQTTAGEEGAASWRRVRVCSQSEQDDLGYGHDQFDMTAYHYGSQDIKAEARGQVFNPQAYDIDALASLTNMAGLTTDGSVPSLSMSTDASQDTNSVDFTGGHIELCMEPHVQQLGAGLGLESFPKVEIGYPVEQAVPQGHTHVQGHRHEHNHAHPHTHSTPPIELGTPFDGGIRAPYHHDQHSQPENEQQLQSLWPEAVRHWPGFGGGPEDHGMYEVPGYMDGGTIPSKEDASLPVHVKEGMILSSTEFEPVGVMESAAGRVERNEE